MHYFLFETLKNMGICDLDDPAGCFCCRRGWFCLIHRKPQDLEVRHTDTTDPETKSSNTNTQQIPITGSRNTFEGLRRLHRNASLTSADPVIFETLQRNPSIIHNLNLYTDNLKQRPSNNSHQDLTEKRQTSQVSDPNCVSAKIQTKVETTDKKVQIFKPKNDCSNRTLPETESTKAWTQQVSSTGYVSNVVQKPDETTDNMTQASGTISKYNPFSKAQTASEQQNLKDFDKPLNQTTNGSTNTFDGCTKLHRNASLTSADPVIFVILQGNPSIIHNLNLYTDNLKQRPSNSSHQDLTEKRQTSQISDPNCVSAKIQTKVETTDKKVQIFNSKNNCSNRTLPETESTKAWTQQVSSIGYVSNVVQKPDETTGNMTQASGTKSKYNPFSKAQSASEQQNLKDFDSPLNQTTNGSTKTFDGCTKLHRNASLTSADPVIFVILQGNPSIIHNLNLYTDNLKQRPSNSSHQDLTEKRQTSQISNPNCVSAKIQTKVETTDKKVQIFNSKNNCSNRTLPETESTKAWTQQVSSIGYVSNVVQKPDETTGNMTQASGTKSKYNPFSKAQSASEQQNLKDFDSPLNQTTNGSTKTFDGCTKLHRNASLTSADPVIFEILQGNPSIIHNLNLYTNNLKQRPSNSSHQDLTEKRQTSQISDPNCVSAKIQTKVETTDKKVQIFNSKNNCSNRTLPETESTKARTQQVSSTGYVSNMVQKPDETTNNMTQASGTKSKYNPFSKAQTASEQQNLKDFDKPLNQTTNGSTNTFDGCTKLHRNASLTSADPVIFVILQGNPSIIHNLNLYTNNLKQRPSNSSHQDLTEKRQTSQISDPNCVSAKIQTKVETTDKKVQIFNSKNNCSNQTLPETESTKAWTQQVSSTGYVSNVVQKPDETTDNMTQASETKSKYNPFSKAQSASEQQNLKDFDTPLNQISNGSRNTFDGCTKLHRNASLTSADPVIFVILQGNPSIIHNLNLYTDNLKQRPSNSSHQDLTEKRQTSQISNPNCVSAKIQTKVETTDKKVQIFNSKNNCSNRTMPETESTKARTQQVSSTGYVSNVVQKPDETIDNMTQASGTKSKYNPFSKAQTASEQQNLKDFDTPLNQISNGSRNTFDGCTKLHRNASLTSADPVIFEILQGNPSIIYNLNLYTDNLKQRPSNSIHQDLTEKRQTSQISDPNCVSAKIQTKIETTDKKVQIFNSKNNCSNRTLPETQSTKARTQQVSSTGYVSNVVQKPDETTDNRTQASGPKSKYNPFSKAQSASGQQNLKVFDTPLNQISNGSRNTFDGCTKLHRHASLTSADPVIFVILQGNPSIIQNLNLYTDNLKQRPSNSSHQDLTEKRQTSKISDPNCVSAKIQTKIETTDKKVQIFKPKNNCSNRTLPETESTKARTQQVSSTGYVSNVVQKPDETTDNMTQASGPKSKCNSFSKAQTASEQQNLKDFDTPLNQTTNGSRNTFDGCTKLHRNASLTSADPVIFVILQGNPSIIQNLNLYTDNLKQRPSNSSHPDLTEATRETFESTNAETSHFPGVALVSSSIQTEDPTSGVSPLSRQNVYMSQLSAEHLDPSASRRRHELRVILENPKINFQKASPSRQGLNQRRNNKIHRTEDTEDNNPSMGAVESSSISSAAQQPAWIKTCTLASFNMIQRVTGVCVHIAGRVFQRLSVFLMSLSDRVLTLVPEIFI
ncbi:uncharacterized protein LOC124870622 isoform X1 [Girardinichthys multiradiatus]|uniref:uncharacterized protein LOC124870622 isoform X1 n=2 Tax=Girardinichthys multiradiatus TaxID=208333 RepID=UPI001FAD4802|nr:uncharacterized protein LOC124870622 isoform X1 [Girardinichthys multiradiatus]